MALKAGPLVAKALEDEGVRWTFGIPGTHNTELYDALEDSKIMPVLVTDEQSASFMADAVSRTSGTVGVANLVPAAGVTNAMSGIGEAYMDGIAMLVLTCGIRTDTGRSYQLHDVDQLKMLEPVTKAVYRPKHNGEVYALVRKAIRLARSGTPGPVAVEIPANLYLVASSETEGSFDETALAVPAPSDRELDEAARLLKAAKRPVLYVGLGAQGAAPMLVDLAEKLGSPVATTIQGKGVFPESHPLWAWNGFGNMAPPYVRDLFDQADAMLAIGCRFGEVATASYGVKPPAALVHVDINPDVFSRNYKAQLAVTSDAAAFVKGLLTRLEAHRDPGEAPEKLLHGRKALEEQRRAARSQNGVTPAVFFEALQKAAKPDAIYSTDSGNGTFLAMEHLRLEQPACFIGPIDYSCMGYSVPGAIGAKFANPDRDVVALAGDGALLMTGLELLTASRYGVAPVVCVLRDKELGQIVQFQRTTMNRATCGVISPYEVKDLAKLTGCEFVHVPDDASVDRLAGAFETARGGKPVMVEVAIDYTFKTFFTKGVVKTNFWRLSWSDRLRMLARAVGRRVVTPTAKP